MIFINMKKKFTPNQIQSIKSKILNEQYTPFPAYGTAGGTIEYAKSVRELNHDVAMVMSIVTAFIPVVGPVISAGWMFLDAYQYHKEGQDEMAGLMAIFAAIPLFGPSLRLAAAPLLAKMGVANRKVLARKIIAYQAGKKVTFTKAEKIILKDIASNPKLIQSQMRKEIARQSAKRSLGKTIAAGTGKFALETGKYMAIAEAWGALYAEMGINVAKLQASLRPVLENIKRAVEMETRAPLQKLATPGMNAGAFSRLPKLEQIIREEYDIIKEKLEDAEPKPKDYSTVKIPFATTADIELFRSHFKNRAGALGADVKKDYDRLQSKMTGADATLADKEFYAKHKDLVDRWWKAEKQKRAEEEEEEGGWDFSDLISSAIWLGIFKSVMEFITSTAVQLSALITSLAFLKMAKGKNAPATIKEAQAIGRFYRLIPRLTRGQIRKLFRKLGVRKEFTDVELMKLQKGLQGSQQMYKSQLLATVVSKRQYAVEVFLKNPIKGGHAEYILRGWLTEAETKLYGKYIEQYIELTEKYGNASWATKWFR